MLTVGGSTKGYGGPPGVRRRELRRGAWRAPPDHGVERCRQDEPAADPDGPDPGRRRRVPLRVRGGGRLLRAGARGHRGRGRRDLRTCGRRRRADDQALRSLLGMFGLPGAMAFQDAGTLSGGEKTKLALAQLVAGRKNLLLLDEPTNNLDPPSRTAIAEALQDWPGAMVIVSHDPGFVEALAPGRVLMMPEGDLDYWDEELLDLVSRWPEADPLPSDEGRPTMLCGPAAERKGSDREHRRRQRGPPVRQRRRLHGGRGAPLGAGGRRARRQDRRGRLGRRRSGRSPDPRPRSSTCRADAPARVPGCPRPPGGRRARHAPVRPARLLDTAEAYLRGDRGLRRARIPRPRGSSAAAGRWTSSPAGRPPKETARRRRPRPARVPRPIATGTAPG